MDGYQVESFLSLGQYSSSDEIIEVTFKSGQTVQVTSNPDKEDYDLWGKLIETLRHNTPALDPRRNFERFNPTNSYGWFDPSSVEFSILGKQQNNACRIAFCIGENHFHSCG